MIKSPISRFGGKFFIADWLARHIPEHNLYCEPFCGAGHLLFTKPPSRVEVLNDLDSYLVDFFRVIQEPDKRQMLIERLKYMPYSRRIWQELRHAWKAGNVPRDEVERVSQWFYLNRTCFGGDQQRGGFAIPSITGRNPCISFRNTINEFDAIAERLEDVTIECLGYADCIQRYDSPETLFYCDPPYWDSEHYYGDTFTQSDHYGLSELLHCVKGKVMITHYLDGIYDELYRDWQRYEYQSFKGSHKSEGEEKPKTIEVLFTNFKTTQRRLF